MQARYIFLFAIILLCQNLSSPINAQSVYQAKAGQEVLLIGGGLATLALGTYLGNQIPLLTEAEINALSPDKINPIDRFATNYWSPNAHHASDYFRNALILAPFALFQNQQTRKDALAFSSAYFGTMLTTWGFTMTVKSIVKRTRPGVYHADAPLDFKQSESARKSFFSGHTSSAFAVATFFAKAFSDYHPNSDWKPWVWGISLSGAATAGILRIIAGKHFPTDVFVGAVTGITAGYWIPELHKKQAKTDKNATALKWSFSIAL